MIKGAGRGSSILGYPTANILPKQEIIPKEGVYVVKVTIKEGLTLKVLQILAEIQHLVIQI